MKKNRLSTQVKRRWKDPEYRKRISSAFRKRRAAGLRPRDSTLEAEAAEREVVTRLSMRGLMAYQYPRNFHAVDVLAFHEHFQHSPRLARISVKFRHKLAASGRAFDIKRLSGVNFVVVLRGGRDGFEDVWVLPKAVAQKLAARRSIPRINFSRIDERYRDAWHLIDKFCN